MDAISRRNFAQELIASRYEKQGLRTHFDDGSFMPEWDDLQTQDGRVTADGGAYEEESWYGPGFSEV